MESGEFTNKFCSGNCKDNSVNLFDKIADALKKNQKLRIMFDFTKIPNICL